MIAVRVEVDRTVRLSMVTLSDDRSLAYLHSSYCAGWQLPTQSRHYSPTARWRH